MASWLVSCQETPTAGASSLIQLLLKAERDDVIDTSDHVISTACALERGSEALLIVRKPTLRRLHFKPDKLAVDAPYDIRCARCSEPYEATVLGLEGAAVVAPEEASLQAEVVEDCGLYRSFFHL